MNKRVLRIVDADKKKSTASKFCEASSCVLIALLALSLLNALSVFPVKASPTTLEVINPLDGTHDFHFTTETTAVGDPFVINITVVDVTDLWQWQIALKWNASLLSYVSIVRPSDHVFSGAGHYVDSQWVPYGIISPPPETGPDYVIWACTYVNGERGTPDYWTFNGTGTLCQITLKIMQDAPAESDLDFVNLGMDTFLLNGDVPGHDIPFTAVKGYYFYGYPSGPYGPLAHFTYYPTKPQVQEYVMFDASISMNGWNGTHTMPIVSYAWDFESDGIIDAYGVTVIHMFVANMTYLVTLNVTDVRGLWDTETHFIKVGWPCFSIVYYDNYNYKTGQWEAWENWYASSQPHYLWNDEYLVNFTSGKTEATTHYLRGISKFDLRGGFWSLDGHGTDEDWNPLKSIGDTVSRMSPHHMFAALFTGWVYFEEGDLLTLESDDDAYIFLDNKTEWGQEILSEPHIHYFYSKSITITAELAGYHLMAVKFAERCDIHSGIQINLNGIPIEAVTPPISVYVDIKPGSWPNPINVASQGVFAIAICGTENFDVTTIDPSTVKIYIEGIEEGVAPIRWSYEDVATPYTGEVGGGHALRGDGYMDLVLHFATQEVVDTLGLGLHMGKTIPLIIMGNLYSELGRTQIKGQDYVRVLLVPIKDKLIP